MLTVYIDFKSADAYLAIAPTLVLAAKHNLSIEWRAFKTIEREVPKLGQEETVGESHRRVRAESQRALSIKYAAHQGIDLVYPAQMGATDLALGVLERLEGDRLPFIRAAFDAFWMEHSDLDDDATIVDLLAKSGVSHSGDLATARADLATAQEQAEAAGIVGTPAYLIQNQIFVGREHLPWIEELVLEIA